MKRPLLVSLIGASLGHAQYIFTNNSVTDNQWTNPENWRLPGMDPATDFPDNGATATASVGSSLFGQSINLSSLTMGGHVLGLDGNTLTITGTLTSTGNDRAENGTIEFMTGSFAGFTLRNATANATNLTTTLGLSLQDGSTLDFTGSLTLNGNAGVSAIGVGLSELTNDGGTLEKTAGTNFSDILVD
ncbi:MAG: hypothetical protein PVJ98_07395 [Akkermansiaceae bacterium]|jgi:hypothetical protein